MLPPAKSESPMEDTRNFGPLLSKINGRESNKFVYLRFNFAKGNLEIISVGDEQVLHVQLLIK